MRTEWENMFGISTKILAYGDGVQRFSTFLRLAFPRVRCSPDPSTSAANPLTRPMLPGCSDPLRQGPEEAHVHAQRRRVELGPSAMPRKEKKKNCDVPSY